nr:ABC transporter ATP-binding protein [Allomuricauda sp.]
MANIIETKNLKKAFGQKNREVVVIDQLNLTIPKGKCTMIMGSSGSGKSTLLYLLSGMDDPTEGTIKIDGIALDSSNEQKMSSFRRNKIGFVFQDHNLISSLTLKENILVAGYLSKESRKMVRERAHALMEKLGIAPLKNRYPTQVSGGQKQRCSIVRAMINQPDIIMADEPTGNLNSSTSTQVLDSLVKAKHKDQSIVMVTHDPKSACYGDRILFMRDGKIVDSLIFEEHIAKEERYDVLLNLLKKYSW